jgi:hypothetical protein
MRYVVGWMLFWVGLFVVTVGRLTFLTGDSIVTSGGKIWMVGCEKLDMRE